MHSALHRLVDATRHHLAIPSLRTRTQCARKTQAGKGAELSEEEGEAQHSARKQEREYNERVSNLAMPKATIHLPVELEEPL